MNDVFPLLELGAKTSRHLEDVIAQLRQENYLVQIKKTAYEFQKGGNEMMIVKATEGSDTCSAKCPSSNERQFRPFLGSCASIGTTGGNLLEPFDDEWDLD